MDIAIIRRRLQLDNELGDAVPDDLLELAFTPPPGEDWRNLPPGRQRNDAIRSLNGVVSYRTLEAYGDRVLNFLISTLIMEDYGLEALPSLLPAYEKILGSNMTLSRIMSELFLCRQIYPDVDITLRHNHCSNSFEAVLGVLYYSLGLQQIKNIYDWYTSLSPVKRIRTLLLERYKGQSLESEEAFEELLEGGFDEELARAMSETPDLPFNWGNPEVIVSRKPLKYTDLLVEASYLLGVNPTVDKDLELWEIDLPGGILVSHEKKEQDAARNLLSQLVRQNFITVVDNKGPYVEGSIPIRYYSRFFQVPKAPITAKRGRNITVFLPRDSSTF